MDWTKITREQVEVDRLCRTTGIPKFRIIPGLQEGVVLTIDDDDRKRRNNLRETLSNTTGLDQCVGIFSEILEEKMRARTENARFDEELYHLASKRVASFFLRSQAV